MIQEVLCTLAEPSVTNIVNQEVSGWIPSRLKLCPALAQEVPERFVEICRPLGAVEQVAYIPKRKSEATFPR